MQLAGLVAVAILVVAAALVSRRLEGSVVTPPILFAGGGYLLGPGGIGLIDLHLGHEAIHLLAEATLVIVLFSDAARIDLALVRRDHDLPVRMLIVGMPLIVVMGTVVAVALPLGLDLWPAALLAAILAPTDAALGQAVVSSPDVPARVRQALNVESGLNDGIALPLVLLFASLAAAHAGATAADWAVFVGAQLVLGPLVGGLVGAAGGFAVTRAYDGGWMEEPAEGAAVIGIMVASYAGAVWAGGNGFIAAFVAGMAFGAMLRGHCQFLLEFAEAEGQLMTSLTFLVFGAVLLPEVAEAAIGPWHLLYAVLTLTVLRMAPIALSLAGTGLSLASLSFLGWFGPRGLASVLFALLVLEDAAFPGIDTVIATTLVTVACSILAHGATAGPAAHRFGAFVRSRGECVELDVAGEMPTRTGWVDAATDPVPNDLSPTEPKEAP